MAARDEHHEIDDLIPLGVRGDLDPAEQAAYEARLAEDPVFAEEAAAYREALMRLRELSEGTGGAGRGDMPAKLAKRITDKVMAALPSADSIDDGTDVPGFDAVRSALRGAQIDRPMPAGLAGRVSARVLASLPSPLSVEASAEADFEHSETLRAANVIGEMGEMGAMPAELADRVTANVLASLPSAEAIAASAEADFEHSATLRAAAISGPMPAHLADRVTENVLASRMAPADAADADRDFELSATLRDANVTGGMPAELADRVTADVLASVPTVESIESDDEMTPVLRAANVTAPMPAALADRVTAHVMASLPSVESIEAGTDVADFDESRRALQVAAAASAPALSSDLADQITATILGSLPVADHRPSGTLHSLIAIMRHPAVAAMLILALGLGLLALPDPASETPDTPGIGNGGTADGSPTPDVEPQPSDDAPDMIGSGNGTRENELEADPVEGIRFGRRRYRGQTVNTIGSSRATDMGVPHAMRRIEGEHNGGGVRKARPDTDQGSFHLPDGEIVPDDSDEILGDF